MRKDMLKTVRLFIFFMVIIFSIIVYCDTVPKQNSMGSYTINIVSMFYTFITIVSILIIDYDKIRKKDVFFALLCGFFALLINNNSNIVRFNVSICTISSYLASQSIFSTYTNKMKMINTKKKEIKKDIILILSISIVYFIILCINKRTYHYYLNLNI